MSGYTLSEYTRQPAKATCVLDQAIERQILEVARNVAPIFQRNEWKWWDSPEPPGAGRIAESLRGLVRSLYKDNAFRVRGGRLVVDREEDETGAFVLRFSLDLGEVDESVEELDDLA